MNLSDGEVVSPILRDKKEDWIELRNVCKLFSIFKINTSVNASGHIHIGANILKDDLNRWLDFLEFYSLFEHILYRFFYGEKLGPRKNIDLYAYPLANIIKSNLSFFMQSDSLEQFGNSYMESILGKRELIPFKNFRLNLLPFKCLNRLKKNLYDTLEFRSPNGTINEVIWQNNINLIARMLLACASGQLDMDLIRFKLSSDFDENYSYSAVLVHMVKLTIEMLLF